jgi:hypothetical protein
VGVAGKGSGVAGGGCVSESARDWMILEVCMNSRGKVTQRDVRHRRAKRSRSYSPPCTTTGGTPQRAPIASPIYEEPRQPPAHPTGASAHLSPSASHADLLSKNWCSNAPARPNRDRVTYPSTGADRLFRSVRDRDGLGVAQWLYKNLLSNEKIDTNVVAYEIDHAVCRLRDRMPSEPERGA